MTNWRRWWMAALLVDVATLVAAASGSHGWWRLLLTVAFASVVPGAAVIAHWTPKEPGAAIALILVASWTLVVLINDGLVQLGWWHPTAVLFVVGAASAASLSAKARPA